MILLPLVAALAVAAVLYAVRHRPAPAIPGVGAIARPVEDRPWWPSSLAGRLGLAALVLVVVTQLLVNVVQIPFLNIALVLGALLLTGIARLVRHDRSRAVLLTFVLTGVMALASLLFLLGEIFIGHE